MKLLIRIKAFLLCVVFSLTAYAKTYYVAPTGGSDYNPGSIDKPWATWQRAFNTAVAGDTVYFRGGVWYIRSQVFNYTNSGTPTKPICYFNYPGEIPILDAINYPASTIDASALDIYGVNNLKFKGLVIRNCRQTTDGQWIAGASFNVEGGVLSLENMTSCYHGGTGFWITGYDTLYLKNCDSYNNCDSTTTSTLPGGRADGFNITSGGTKIDTFKIAYVSGCRAWGNSDDGFDISTGKQVDFHDNWIWATGKLSGDACGIKMAAGEVLTTSKRKWYNNITAYNYGGGWIDVNLNDPKYGIIGEFYNNTSYKDGVGRGTGDGAYDCDLIVTKAIYRNDLIYGSTEEPGVEAYFKACDYGFPTYVVESHNTWTIKDAEYYETYPNPAYTVTDADFVSLDTAQLRWPRKADGSLPEISFMKLKEGSDLIDRGINVGLPYNGTAPDLGYSEYVSGSAAIQNPIYVSSVIENATPARLEMTYSMSLANIVPPASAFTVKVGSITRSVSSVVISGTKVLLTLVSPVVYGDLVTVAYSKPSTNPLQTAYGGQAASLAAQNVSNNVAAQSPVYVSSVVENATPTRLEMTYSMSLANIVPPVSAFTVRVGSIPRSVSSVVISGAKVLLTLTAPVVYGDIVTVGYSKPSTNPLQSVSGGQAASITGQSVINNCSLTVNQPPLVSISSPTKSSSFNAPAYITIEALASDPDGSVAKVEFFNGSIKLGEGATPPYSYVWKEVSEGTYFITAVAFDNLNAKTVSEVVIIVVEKSTTVVNQVPVISFIKPSKGKKNRKHDNIEIEVEAYDPDGTISSVELKNGSITLAILRESPYIYILQDVDTGTFVLTAIATDNLGASAESTALEFEVYDYNASSEGLNLYPNPNNGNFSLDVYSSLPGESNNLSVISLSGITVFTDVISSQENYKEFDLSAIAAGSYLLMITNGNSIIAAKKFIKE